MTFGIKNQVIDGTQPWAYEITHYINIEVEKRCPSHHTGKFEHLS